MSAEKLFRGMDSWLTQRREQAVWPAVAEELLQVQIELRTQSLLLCRGDRPLLSRWFWFRLALRRMWRRVTGS